MGTMKRYHTYTNPLIVEHPRTYRSWVHMLHRCNPNGRSKCFKYYGGRGITVCERWKVYANFLADMGDRPEGYSLDRVNNDGNYEPGNCRWATSLQQNNNRRKGTRRGEKQWRAVLSDQDVRDIRANWALCRTTRTELAERFGATRDSVSKIIAGTSRLGA